MKMPYNFSEHFDMMLGENINGTVIRHSLNPEVKNTNEVLGINASVMRQSWILKS